MGETPKVDDVDIEFVIRKNSYRAAKEDKVTIAHYIYVDLIAFGNRESSFVIGIAEERSVGKLNTSGVVIDITTAAMRKEFDKQVVDFSKKLDMLEVTNGDLPIEGMTATNELFEDYSNRIVSLENMYRIILDLRLHEKLAECADPLEKFLGEFVSFEATDERIVTPPEQPVTSLYSERYDQWGTW